MAISKPFPDKVRIGGMRRLEQAIREDTELSQRVKLIYHNPPPVEHGKDYNEFLCAQLAAVREESIKKRPISTAR